MPVGPFEDFDACVSHFQGDPNVDDPEALCGWMEQNKDAIEGWNPEEDSIEDLVRALSDPAAEQVLQNLKVTFVSGVENPAQDSQWVMAKDTDAASADWGVTSPIVVKEGQLRAAEDRAEQVVQLNDEADEERKAWAPVLVPNETDKQGDVIPVGEIETAAHEFLAKYRNIDTDHDLFDGKGVPIESWTLKESQTFALPDGGETREYPEGTWMMGVKFTEDAWERVKAGELTGFSIYGEAENVPVDEILGGEAAEIARNARIQFSKDAEDSLADADLREVYEAIEKVADTAGVPACEVVGSVVKRSLPISGENRESTDMKDNEQPRKQLGADEMAVVAETLRAYFEDHGGTVTDTSLEEFLNWALEDRSVDDLDDTVEIGGVEIPIRPESEPEEPGEVEETMTEKDQEQEAAADGGEETEETEDSTEESVKDAIEAIKSTVEENNELAKSNSDKLDSHGSRLDDLEKEVFGEDTEEKDADDGEETEDSTEETKEESESEDTEDATEESKEEDVEEAVKSILGIDGDLPDDPEERKAVIRKNVSEPGAEAEAPTGVGMNWESEDLEELI